MNKYDYHVCFVSGQNVAELSGALHPELRVSRVKAIVSRETRKQAANLEKACRLRGVKCQLVPLARVSVQEITALLDSIGEQGASFILNITGGTKLMSIAAYAWASRNRVPVFYVDAVNDDVQLYENDSWRTLAAPAPLKFENLLNLYGYEIKSKTAGPLTSKEREATEKLAALASHDAYANAFILLNAKANEAQTDPGLSASFSPSSAFEEILAACKSAGKLEYSHSRIIFADEVGRKWCNGIWLEEYVHGVLSRLESDEVISSYACSVNVVGEDTPNELDAVFTARNRLFVIECKTSRIFEKQGSVSTSLYKADSLKGRLGGIYAKSMLCTLFSPKKGVALRAANMGIKLVCGPDLPNLRNVIIEWIRQK